MTNMNQPIKRPPTELNLTTKSVRNAPYVGRRAPKDNNIKNGTLYYNLPVSEFIFSYGNTKYITILQSTLH